MMPPLPEAPLEKRGRGLLLAASKFPEGKGCFLGYQAPFERVLYTLVRKENHLSKWYFS
jgi:hypothetical protein